MFEEIPDDVKFMISQPKAVHYTQDGPSLEINTYGNIDPDERIEVIAKAHGVSPDDVKLMDNSTAAGRLVVGFSKWRSSWDPHANGADPNLN